MNKKLFLIILMVSVNPAVHAMNYFYTALAVLGGSWFVWRQVPSLSTLSTDDPITQELGFNPLGDQKILPADSGKIPVLCAQGWPEKPNASKEAWPFLDETQKALNVEEVFTIDCNPRDSIKLHEGTTSGLIEGLRTINFGDVKDALPILYILKKCHELGHTKVYGFGHSRGGSSWATALDMLQNPADYYAAWKTLGMMNKQEELDMQKINALKAMVENGWVYLGNPWIHTDYPLNKVAESSLSSLPEISTTASTVESSTWLIKGSLVSTTDYNPLRSQPYELLKKIIEQNKKFTVHVDFACNDPVVGDIHNQEMVDYAKKNENLIVRQYTYEDSIKNQNHMDLTASFYYARQKIKQKK